MFNQHVILLNAKEPRISAWPNLNLSGASVAARIPRAVVPGAPSRTADPTVAPALFPCLRDADWTGTSTSTINT